ncbi:hypothetical protein [Streptomyces sp. NPDC059009]|uniref:hypothetical protein n=1 Tax=Streptomyces sp. NPDC059009 TaxID=3346694 RepID=UPI0036B9BB51
MTLKTTSPRTTARLRITALLAVPVLALTAACSSGDGEGVEDKGVASAPDAPDTSASKGSSGSGEQSAGQGKGAFYDAQMKYVQCMRTKGGVKEFPDPKLSGYLDWTKIDELSARYPEAAKGGKDAACGPELQKAMQKEPERDPQQEYESMLAHAKCMREKGVSKYRNPTMSGGNVLPGGDPDPANPSFDSTSPAYKRAAAACKDKLLDGLDGMQG